MAKAEDHGWLSGLSHFRRGNKGIKGCFRLSQARAITRYCLPGNRAMPAISLPILICCRLSTVRLAHHTVGPYLAMGLYTSWNDLSSRLQLPYLLPDCPAGSLAGWLQAIARLQQQKIAQKLRIQPPANHPNRQGESGICVELPTSFLIRDFPPPCLGAPSPTPNTNLVRRQQIRIGRMLSIPLGWLGHKLIASALHSFG